jgi:uncharacterized protein YggE
MFKIIIISILSIFTLNAFASDLIIKDKLYEYKYVTPDTIVSGFRIYVKNKDFSKVNKKMEYFLTIVKKHKDICPSSSYYINPEYKYTDGKRKLLGYIGNINTYCKFNDMKKYENILNEVYSKVDSTKKITISLSRSNWMVSESISEKTQKELKQKVILSAYENAKIFSKTTKKICSLKEINYTNNSDVINYWRDGVQPVRMMAAKKINMQAPIKKDKKISISATYLLECED